MAIAGDLTAFLAWNTKSVGSLATLFSFVEGLIGLWGTWTVGSLMIRRGGNTDVTVDRIRRDIVYIKEDRR